MIENKKEPLNSSKKKKQVLKKPKIVHQKKKEIKKSSSILYYIIFSLIAIALFCLLLYLINRNIKKISDLDNDIVISNEKLENEKNEKIKLLNKINEIKKEVNKTEEILKQKISLDKDKAMEYEEIKKIYHNMKEVQNKIIIENDTSIILEKSIEVLNARLKDLSEFNKMD